MEENEVAESEKRIRKLIEEKNALKMQMMEMQAELKAATEATASAEAKTAKAVEEATSTLTARVSELEGEVLRGGLTSAILADGIPSDDVEELLEYLQTKYEKVEADDKGVKSSFTDWYSTFKDTSKVVQSYRKAPASEGEDGEKPAVKPAPKAPPVGTKPVPKKDLPETTTPIPTAKGTPSSGAAVDATRLKPGTPEWNAEKERVKKAAMIK